MVYMTNGLNNVKVPNGAVQDFIRRGFHVVGSTKAAKEVAPVEAEATSDVPEEIEDEKESGEDEFAELLAKPINQWNKTELKNFTTAKGIDTSGASNVAAVKKIVSDWIEQQQ